MIVLWFWVAGMCLMFVRVWVFIGQRWAETNDIDPLDRMDSRVGAVVLGLLSVPLWPLAIPAVVLFRRGFRAGLSRLEMQQQLDEANREIERIKRSEGWS